MMRSTPLVSEETYHVFNRGAHKSTVFSCKADYERFLLLLFLCNSSKPVNMREALNKYKGRTFAIFTDEERGEPLVSVLAYALMPNHFHIVLRQVTDGGISAYMRKIGTAYSMYFNTKYEHSGILAQGKFKSSHIDNEAYFRYIFSYVHLNPVDLVENGWEERGIRNPARVRDFLNTYRYSSFMDHSVGERPETAILDRKDLPEFLVTQNDLDDMLIHVAHLTKVGPL